MYVENMKLALMALGVVTVLIVIVGFVGFALKIFLVRFWTNIIKEEWRK